MKRSHPARETGRKSLAWSGMMRFISPALMIARTPGCESISFGPKRNATRKMG
jgi:hypothetical protein